jgi:hypothetical protein
MMVKCSGKETVGARVNTVQRKRGCEDGVVMGGFGSEPRSEPEPVRSELQSWVRVRGFDLDRTIGSVLGSANSRTLANGF